MDGYPVSILCNGTHVSGTNPLPTSANITVASTTTTFAPTLTDAFGRLRVSNPFTLFDSFYRFQDNGKIGEYTSNNASSTYSNGTVVMSVGSNIGDRIYRESTRVFAYQPGKSLLILQTFCMNPAKTGLRQRQGYFDTENGFYIQLNGSRLSLVRRSTATGQTVNLEIDQANWNYDPMDGTGPSGYVLDYETHTRRSDA